MPHDAHPPRSKRAPAVPTHIVRARRLACRVATDRGRDRNRQHPSGSGRGDYDDKLLLVRYTSKILWQLRPFRLFASQLVLAHDLPPWSRPKKNTFRRYYVLVVSLVKSAPSCLETSYRHLFSVSCDVCFGFGFFCLLLGSCARFFFLRLRASFQLVP